MILRHLRFAALQRVPLLAWMALGPASSLVGLVLIPGHAVAILTSALVSFSAVLLVTVTAGWASLPELVRLAPGDVRSERRRLAREQEVLREAVHQLARASVTSRRTTSRLVDELVRSEESVRAQIAGELHDTVAQTLSAAIMALEGVEQPLHREGRDAVRDAEQQLRVVLSRIRPPEIGDGSLAEAVRELCMELEHRYGTVVRVSWQDTAFELSQSTAVLVYRVVQESLLNAVEHADGSGLALDVWVRPTGGPLHQLHVAVSDTGPGFDPQGVVSIGGRHVGLKLARDRVEIAGGSLVVDSAPGRGTRVTLQLPVHVDTVAAEQRPVAIA